MDSDERTPRLSARQQAVLALRLQEQSKSGPPMNEPIAIIGMGCRFPGGADSPESYWHLLKQGVDAVGEIPPERWPLAQYYDTDPGAEGKMYSRWGAFLDQADGFDATFFGLAPREVANMDPQHRLLLEVTWEALESAGIVPGSLERTSTGVFVGISTADYARLGGLERIDAYYGTGNSFSVAAGRIAHLLGVQGPVFALDTACSSSLVALHQAVNSLRARECNLALVGGVNLTLVPDTTVFFSKLKALSPDGRCKAFDAAANGYVRGEGAGAVVLKRLSSAIRDGDAVLAVVRGTAINHDGPSSGLTVPNGPAQQSVIRQALRDGNVHPSQIGYIEAHGTGTPLGDPIEMHALAAVFERPNQGQADAADQPLYVGSVKSNLGHLEAAAGIAGLLKVVLALQHRQIPPHLHFHEPSPHIDWHRLGDIRIPTQLTDWAATDGRPRMAGVSSFGFSGTNAHIVVEEAPPAAHAPEPATELAPGEVLLALSARSEASLRSLAQRYHDYLVAQPEVGLADVAYTAARRRAHYEHRLAVVGATPQILAEKLLAFVAGETRDGLAADMVRPERSDRVVFAFPGQGPEWPGMGRQLYAHSAAFRETVEQCDGVVRAVAGWSLLNYFQAGDGPAAMSGVDVIHPLLFTMQVGLARVWQTWGIRPAAVVGQSLGEISALCAAGSLSLEDGLTLMIRRSSLMARLQGQGRMAMVGLSAADALALIEATGEELYLAVERGPDSVVVAGRPGAVDRLVARLKADGIYCRVVVDGVASHCPIAAPIAAEMGQQTAGLISGPSDVAFYSTVTGSRLAPETIDGAYWQRNILEPVRWHQTVRALLADGYALFVEASPHPTLLSVIEQVAARSGLNVVTVGSSVRQQDEMAAMLGSGGKLYAGGASLDWERLYPAGRLAAVPTYAWDRERHWIANASTHSRHASRRQPTVFSGPASLRGKRLASPLELVQFETSFDSTSLPYLRDHVVGGVMVVAGASHVAQFLEVAATVQTGRPVVLRNVSFLEPMIVDEGQALQVQAHAAPAANGHYSLQIYGRLASEDPAEKWLLHASAILGPGQQENSGAMTLPGDKADWMPLPLDEYHSALDAQPYQLSGSFRRLEGLWRANDGSLVGRFRRPATTDERADYSLHPGLIDSSFQAIGAAAFFDASRQRLSPGEIFVPVAIETARWHRDGQGALWCRATTRRTDSPEETRGDVEIFDDTGQLVAEIVAFQARRMAASRIAGTTSRRISRWLYELQWQPMRLGLPALPTRGQWLILADRGGLSGAVADELRRRGGFPILVPSDALDLKPEAYARLVEEALAAYPDVRGVLHFWSLDHRPAVNRDIQPAVDQICLSGLYLAQALSSLPSQPRMWLVTQEAVAVDRGSIGLAAKSDAFASKRPRPRGQAVGGLWQSALWGLGRAVMTELPGLRCSMIDVAGPVDAAGLVDEILAGTAENQVALRDGKRLVARLAPLGSDGAAGTAQPGLPVRPDATYLISGGFGGLGLAVAGWLFEKGARHLLLLGRRAPSPEVQAQLDGLRAGGAAVGVAIADVADRAQLSAALGMLEDMPPLAGVIHAAGTLDDGLIANMDAARLERVTRAKVFGAWHLHELTSGRDLDFFVLFSSIAAIFGSPGQANHAAASAFLDQLAHYRRSLGLPGLSINWGPWAGIGAAAGKKSAERVIAAGMAPIEADWGLALLEHLLQASPAQAIAMSVDWAQWFRALPASLAAPYLSDMAKSHAAEDGGAAASVAAELSRLSRPEDRRDYLQAFLARQIAQVLRLPPAKIDAHTPFGSLGFDSLMALEVKNNLERQLALVLPVSLVWNYPTVAELTGYIAGELGISLNEDQSPAPSRASEETDVLAELSENELLDLLGDKLKRLDKSL
jgi:myxalamid-type polyketide synthase MxaD